MSMKPGPATKPGGPMSEAQLQAAIVETARLLGWLVYHTRDSRGSEPGFPDIVLVRGMRETGRVIFAELKTDRGVVSTEQQKWVTRLLAATFDQPGVSVHVWRPEHWRSGEIEAVLRG